MPNAIPMQFSSDNKILYDKDSSLTRSQIEEILITCLGDECDIFQYKTNQRFATGHYKNYYFIVANITSMGGREGQHPLDLKRIQYNSTWRDFYNDHRSMGKVLWLGLYSYDNQRVFGFFEPETYLSKHLNKPMTTKSGLKSNYSCHIFLNDLFMGKENNWFKKSDKNNNTVGAINPNFLKTFLEDEQKENPIISTIQDVNKTIPWNEWIEAKDAITYMYSLKEKTGFNNWKQNLWNGWFIEAKYSEYFSKHESQYVSYIDTSKNDNIRRMYGAYDLDLALYDGYKYFIGDLKGVSSKKGNTDLNDETHIQKALDDFKKIWFVFYLHDKKRGDYNDYEMVKWRNRFIADVTNAQEYNEMSAPRTPHSVKYEHCIIVELNDVTREKFFSIGNQRGLNSDGRERNRKYKFDVELFDKIFSDNKSMQSVFKDDGFVIYRE